MRKTDKSIEIMGSMRDIMHQMKHYMKNAYKDSGITPPQGYVLSMLGKTGKKMVHELGEKLSMTDSTVSGIVDRLEKLGMVKRTRSKEDKRVVFVEITSKFNDMHGDFHKQLDQSISKIISAGTPGELEKITEGLEIMKKLLSNNETEKRKKS